MFYQIKIIINNIYEGMSKGVNEKDKISVGHLVREANHLN